MSLFYFDHNATMPSPEGHLREVMEQLVLCEGNPSTSHYLGRRAKRILEEGRMEVAQLIGAERSQVIFVSGATEANAWVISSVARCMRRALDSGAGVSHRMIVAAGEHSSHLRNLRFWCDFLGLEYVQAPLTPGGTLDLSALKQLLDERVGYLGCSAVHHEVGIKQPLEQIRDLTYESGAQLHWHVDGAQAFGKEALDVADLGMDSLSMSGHKIGAVAGIGAVYASSLETLHPLLLGGSQERALRAGTENMVGVVSLLHRLRDIASDGEWLEEPRRAFRFLSKELACREGVVVHGDQSFSAGLALSFSIKGWKSAALQSIWEGAGMALGFGSACRRDFTRPLAVLEAMKVPEDLATDAIRISLGPGSDVEQIRRFLEVVDTQILGVSSGLLHSKG